METNSCELTGQIAIVTGGGRGFGREIVHSAAKVGVKVTVVARSATQLSETDSLIQKDGDHIIAITADVTNSSAASRMGCRPTPLGTPRIAHLASFDVSHGLTQAPRLTLCYDLCPSGQFIDHAARDGSQLATVETAGAMHGNLEGHIQLRIAQLIKLKPRASIT